MFIVNCSWIIKAGWWIVKAFLDEKTVSKINIYGSGYREELLKHVAAENLPSFLGGKCECKPGGCINQSDGPWKKIYDQVPKEDDEKNVTYPPLPQKWKAPSS